MCVKNEINNPQVAATARSPWRRLFREPLRPRLSRKVISSARVNLNKYWLKFEELAKSKSPLTENFSYHHDDNEINDNLINELNERNK